MITPLDPSNPLAMPTRGNLSGRSSIQRSQPRPPPLNLHLNPAFSSRTVASPPTQELVSPAISEPGFLAQHLSPRSPHSATPRLPHPPEPHPQQEALQQWQQIPLPALEQPDPATPAFLPVLHLDEDPEANNQPTAMEISDPDNSSDDDVIMAEVF